MKPLFIHFLFVWVLMAACNADPNVISDDTLPTGPGQPLECDSLPVPNSVFSNAIGEVLIFADSLGLQHDTLICAENEAYQELVENATGDFCQTHYSTAYTTKWQAAPDIYSIRFSHQKGNSVELFSCNSVPLNDFGAWSSDAQTTIFQRDSITINGVEFKQVMVYVCRESEPCAFVQSLVLDGGGGLVAFQRQGKWWTKR